MGSELKMSTSFRPQTDGQTKRVNLVIQQFLRNYDAPLSPWLNPLEGPNVELRKIEDLRAAPDFQH
jgi:hypothetical protein